MQEKRQTLVLVEDHGRTVGEAFRGHFAPDELEALRQTPDRIGSRLVHAQEKLRILDDIGELRGHRLQGGDIRLLVALAGIPLEDENAHFRDAAGNGHRQERVVPFLEDARKELVVGVAAGVHLANRPHLLESQSRQSLAQLQMHPADGLRVQALGGAEGQLLLLGVVKVNGTDGGLGAPGHHLHGPVQQGLDAGALSKEMTQLADVIEQLLAIHETTVVLSLFLQADVVGPLPTPLSYKIA